MTNYNPPQGYPCGVYLTYQQEELIADLISTYGEQIIYITNKIFNKLNDKGKI